MSFHIHASFKAGAGIREEWKTKMTCPPAVSVVNVMLTNTLNKTYVYIPKKTRVCAWLCWHHKTPCWFDKNSGLLTHAHTVRREGCCSPLEKQTDATTTTTTSTTHTHTESRGSRCGRCRGALSLRPPSWYLTSWRQSLGEWYSFGPAPGAPAWEPASHSGPRRAALALASAGPPERSLGLRLGLHNTQQRHTINRETLQYFSNISEYLALCVQSWRSVWWCLKLS